MKRASRRASAKDRKAFVERVTELVIEAGARSDIDTIIYTYNIPVTRFGPLYVSIHESLDGSAVGSIMCRFEFPELAVGNVGGERLNPYSGKWNWHFSQWTTVDDAVAQFRHALERILISNVLTPACA